MSSRIFSAALALGAASIVGAACGTGGGDLFASGGAGPSSTGSGGTSMANGGSSVDGGGGSTSSGGAPATGGGGHATGGAPSTGGAGGAGGHVPACGDGTRQAPEVCDGHDVGAHDCTEFGFKNPAGLGCSSDCMHLDPSTCHAVCGNDKIEPGETCDDGNTTGGDGCSATCQRDSVAGSTCATAIPVALGLGSGSAAGSTVGGGAHAASTCTSGAADIVYAVTVSHDGFLTASLARPGTSFDSVLYASTDCDDHAPVDVVGCNDSHAGTGDTPLLGGDLVSFQVADGDTVYVFVDGKAAGDAGTFSINFDLSTGADCSDPVPIPLAPGSPMTISGSNGDNPANTQGTCGGGPGGDVVYAITTPVIAGAKVATQNLDYNAALYARNGCGAPSIELACSNAGGNGTNEAITIPGNAAGSTFALFVDGSQIGGGSANGDYELVLSPP